MPDNRRIDVFGPSVPCPPRNCPGWSLTIRCRCRPPHGGRTTRRRVCWPQAGRSALPTCARPTDRAAFPGMARANPFCGGHPTRAWCCRCRRFACIPRSPTHSRLFSPLPPSPPGGPRRQRKGRAGTWIVPEMGAAYIGLHAAGHAHSVETWVDGELVGGLYCVALGRAVFGESMFADATDASKIALSALVGLCLHHGIAMIDCQQNTPHLASLGAREIPRAQFLRHIEKARQQHPLAWTFEPVYWDGLLGPCSLGSLADPFRH